MHVVEEPRGALIYVAARRHYMDGATMETIAQELGVSRPTVSRLLARARETGVVRITLAEPPGADSPTAHRIADAFDIRVHLVPVPSTTSAADRLRAVAAEAAVVLDSLVVDGTNLGIAWGVTTGQVARSLASRGRSGVQIVQMNGAAHASDPATPYIGSLLQTYASAFGAATIIPFPVPTFFDHAATREAMWRERSVLAVLRRIRELDVAIFGVGYPGARMPSHAYAAGHIDPPDLARALSQGAVGDVCTVLLRADGTYKGIELNARASGPTPQDLRNVPSRLCVVGDPSRAVALLAALRSGCVTHLVCDDVTAGSVIRLMDA